MRIYYFGCVEVLGHYLIDSNGNKVSMHNNGLPWIDIDYVLCPRDTGKQGIVKIHHKKGWTAAAFHDYSVDKRPGSNSILFVEDLLDITEIISTFKEIFPQIYKRFDFELVEWLIPEER